MRVVGGRFRGKTLVAPSGLATRPTTDRVRENLFNIMASRFSFDDTRVIDLFAGTGALGLEALSRGAAFCLFVETATPAMTAIRRNVETLGLGRNAEILRSDATKLGHRAQFEPFNIAFADPPYGRGLGQKAAQNLTDKGWLCDNAIFILEEEKGSMPDVMEGFETVLVRSYGDTAIGLFEYPGARSIC